MEAQEATRTVTASVPSKGRHNSIIIMQIDGAMAGCDMKGI
jgi:hypothetical protein